MKILVVGYDTDEQQTFWDVIPVTCDYDTVEDIEDVYRLAVARFERLRPYAAVVDVLTVELLAAMAHRMLDGGEDEAEAAYSAMEREEEARPAPSAFERRAEKELDS